MGYNLEKHEAAIDKGYEMYQIIKDFDNSIQIFREAFQNSIDEDATEVYCRVIVEPQLGVENLIIDIWDNGSGLREQDIPCFFGLAKSTKLTSDKMPTGKLGYKGHGTKIYFNSQQIEIFSKPHKDKAGWGVVLKDPVRQIREVNTYRYSEVIRAEDCSIQLPDDFQTGFFLRIINPSYFRTQYTRFMLNHLFLRDYSKWYTVFGNIRALFDPNTPTATLYLQGLNIEYLRSNYKDLSQIDPLTEFAEKDSSIYEKIGMGHYFPPQRSSDTSMKTYTQKIDSKKPYYDYYSREIYKDTAYLDNNIKFDFVIYAEGYETKRRYDILLSRTEKTSLDRSLQHTDAERYGLWACKGGVPIERVDDWIMGGRGIGTYTYMHAFVDCDAFELTSNRGSIRNTDWEILEQVKRRINGILSDKRIQRDLRERQEWADYEKTQRSVDEDAEELKNRFNLSKSKRNIILPNEIPVPEPTLTKSGYSESETLMLLSKLMDYCPDLFTFNILDYNTTKGIDFVVEKGGTPKYIELKGTFRKKINHSFRNIYKFICYDIDVKNNDTVEDVEKLTVVLRINHDDHFESFDEQFKGKKFTSYQLMPTTTAFESMEIIVLKKLLTEVVGASFE